MQRLFLAFNAFMTLAAVIVVVLLGGALAGRYVSSYVSSLVADDSKQPLKEKLDYMVHGDGMFVTCDAKIVDQRHKCVPPHHGRKRVASCYAESWEEVANGDLSCTGDWWPEEDKFGDEY
jgi:hypothetical protein